MTTVRLIPEAPGLHGGRLGRHVEHDPRSRGYAVAPARAATDLRPVLHRRHGKILDQGGLGSCTGNAAVGAIETEPLKVPGTRYSERTAVSVYSRATTLDDIPGAYPPDDTGSSGLAVAKVLVEMGVITVYRHAFGIMEALTALQDGPLITGIDWHEGFDRPDGNGLVTLSGQVRGGHEIVVRGYQPGDVANDPLSGEVYADNSWGLGWGQHGSFRILVRDWAQLLQADGDATVLVR